MEGRRIVALGSVLAGLGVVFGAFGAHGLRGRLSPDLLEVFEVAVRYQLYHAIALVLAGLLAMVGAQSRGAVRDDGTGAAAACFALGIAVFCGSLYALAFTGLRWLGAITPLGGLAFIAGWFLLARAAWRRP